MTKHPASRPSAPRKASAVSWAALSLLGATLACGAPPPGEAEEDGDGIGRTEQALTFDQLCGGGPRARVACALILTEVNQALAKQNLQLDNRGLVYNYDDRSGMRVGGSACSPLESTRRTAQVTLTRQTRLDLEGNALTQPLVFGFHLPVDLAVTAHMRQRNGFRIPFGGCGNLPTDGYRINARASTEADVVVSFWLNPKFVRESGLKYEISVEPELRVDAALEVPRLSTSTSGVNPVSAVYRGLSGLASFIGDAAETIIKGHDFDELEQDLALAGLDIANLFLPDGPGNLIGQARDRVIRHLVDEQLKDREGAFVTDLEDKLRSKIAAALGLNAAGKRVFIVDLQRREVQKPALAPSPNHKCDRNSDCRPGFICDPIGFRGARVCCEPEDDGSCL